MNVKDAISSRCSIRKWKEKEVPDEIIAELLEAARRAPSAKNVQSHRYIILKAEDVKVMQGKDAFIQPYVYEAPLIIVCCADPSQYPVRSDVDEDSTNYAYIDLSIAAAFMTLRATELGLGSVFVAWINRDIIKEVFKLPENFIVPFIIPFGYPDEKPLKKSKLFIKEGIIAKTGC